MAGYNHVFLRILIAQARAAVEQPDHCDIRAQAFLASMVTGLFSLVKNGGSVLLSSSLNGKSITFMIPQGMTKTDVMISAQSAMEWLAAGLNGPTTEIYGRTW